MLSSPPSPRPANPTADHGRRPRPGHQPPSTHPTQPALTRPRRGRPPPKGRLRQNENCWYSKPRRIDIALIFKRIHYRKGLLRNDAGGRAQPLLASAVRAIETELVKEFAPQIAVLADDPGFFGSDFGLGASEGGVLRDAWQEARGSRGMGG